MLQAGQLSGDVASQAGVAVFEVAEVGTRPVRRARRVAAGAREDLAFERRAVRRRAAT